MAKVSPTVWRQQNSDFVYIAKVSKKSQSCASLSRDCQKDNSSLFHTLGSIHHWFISCMNTYFLLNPQFSTYFLQPHFFFPKSKFLHPEEVSIATQFYDSPLISAKEKNLCIFTHSSSSIFVMIGFPCTCLYTRN